MGTLLQDLRYAARTLVRQPGFTVIAVLTLAVGIGANTAIYTVVDATILRTLPFQEPDRLMKVALTTPSVRGRPANDNMVWSYPKYETFRANQQVYSDTALYRSTTVNLTGTDEPERLRAEIVGASYHSILGVRPILGRTFLPEEDVVPEKVLVAIISHSLWQRRYGSDPAIAGKTISLDQRGCTIVGVLPSGFQGLTGPADVWMPAHVLGPDEFQQAQSHSWELVARIKPGVTTDQAASAVAALGPGIEAANPMRNFPGWSAKARTLDEVRVEPAMRKSILVLFGAVGFVLLIACVNIANLLLARGTARQREIAIRLAVGANRLRLVRQLLTESVVLAVIGGAASLLLAWVGVQALASINPTAGNPFGMRMNGLTAIGLGSMRLDPRALLFTFGIALATGILFGLAPAFQGSRADVTGALKGAGHRDSGLGVTSKSALIVVEVALAMVLLIGAGLMIKSFGRLLATRTGVDPENVLTVRINLPAAESSMVQAVPFFSELERRVTALPGVLSASLANCYAVAGGCNGTIFWHRDRENPPDNALPSTGVHFISPGYLRTMKVPLLRGRWFTGADVRGAPKVVLISDAAARRFFPGEDPIGKPIGVGQGGFGDRAEIIGVVGDVRYGQMEEPVKPEVYISHLQAPRTSLILFARTAGNPTALSQAVRQQVQSLNRDLPIFDIKTMRERISDSTARPRFSAILLAVFAAIALILAAIGIYGVMSYLVTQRTREIGIRIALGAGSSDVVSLVVRRGGALALAGIALGLGGALAATQVLSTLLYEVKPGDAATYVEIGVVLAAVALIASYIPARRASSVDPSLALRAE